MIDDNFGVCFSQVQISGGRVGAPFVPTFIVCSRGVLPRFAMEL